MHEANKIVDGIVVVMGESEFPPEHIDARTREEGPDHLAPLTSIRKHCLWCCNGSAHEVGLCVSKACPLWLLRFGRKPTADELAAVTSIPTQPLEAPATQAEVAEGSRLKAIRRRCLDCSGDSPAKVRTCRATDCTLHPY